MEDSIFVTEEDDKQTPLLQGYEPLQDFGPNRSDYYSYAANDNGGAPLDGRQAYPEEWGWSSGDGGGGSDGGRKREEDDHPGLVQSLMPPMGDGDGTHASVECAFDDVYRYYWLRGLWKFVSGELGHMFIMTWLVLFCVFLGTCVDYHAIASFTTPTHTTTSNNTVVATSEGTSIWSYIRFGGPIGWYFIVSLILYCIYAAWRVFRFARDLRRMVRVRVFYRDVLQISDFNLRTARWADVLERLKHVAPENFGILRINGLAAQKMHRICQQSKVISSIITKRDNTFKRLLETGLLDFTLTFRLHQRLAAFFSTPSIEISMLTRGLQWNLMHCVVNFFFDSELRLKPVRNVYDTVARLRKRIVVLAILNIVMLPFLVVFVALYAIFRYGEQFYKDPSSVGARQWSAAARWYFRDYSEMPHVFEERLRLSSRFAKHYTKQFAAGALEGVARAIAFILGSIVVWLLTLSLINEHVLLSLDISPGKSVLWWITVLSGGWVVFRSMLQTQQVFYPADALQVVHGLVRHLPPHFLENPGSRQVLKQFYHLYPLRISVLLQEFAGLVVTPWIMLRRVYPNVEEIVDTFEMNTRYENLRGYYLGPDLEQADNMMMEDEEALDVDFNEKSVLQSIHLVPYLQNLDTAILRTDESL